MAPHPLPAPRPWPDVLLLQYDNRFDGERHNGSWAPFHRGWCSVKSWGLVFVKGKGAPSKGTNTKATAVA